VTELSSFNNFALEIYSLQNYTIVFYTPAKRGQLSFGRGAAGVLDLDARLATAAGHDVRE